MLLAYFAIRGLAKTKQALCTTHTIAIPITITVGTTPRGVRRYCKSPSSLEEGIGLGWSSHRKLRGGVVSPRPAWRRGLA